MLSRGGSSPEGGAEVGEDGAVGEVGDDGAELAGAPGFDPLPPLLKRGGSSLLSIPTGTDSAVCGLFAGSVPAGRHNPVPSHGLCTLTELLCSALPTVNSPSELPVCSPSYTVPDSNAIGTGFAL